MLLCLMLRLLVHYCLRRRRRSGRIPGLGHRARQGRCSNRRHRCRRTSTATAMGWTHFGHRSYLRGSCGFGSNALTICSRRGHGYGYVTEGDTYTHTRTHRGRVQTGLTPKPAATSYGEGFVFRVYEAVVVGCCGFPEMEEEDVVVIHHAITGTIDQSHRIAFMCAP